MRRRGCVALLLLQQQQPSSSHGCWWCTCARRTYRCSHRTLSRSASRVQTRVQRHSSADTPTLDSVRAGNTTDTVAAAAAAATRSAPYTRTAARRQGQRPLYEEVSFALGNGMVAAVQLPCTHTRRRRRSSTSKKSTASSAQQPVITATITTTTTSAVVPASGEHVAVMDTTDTGPADAVAVTAAVRAVDSDTLVADLAKATATATTKSGDVTHTSAAHVFDKLRTHALPTLLQSTRLLAAAHDADGAAVMHGTEATTRTTRKAVTPRVVACAVQLLRAQRTLLQALQLVSRGGCVTGRRYEPALPTSVVMMLWLHAMPTLHALCTTLPPQQQQQDNKKSAKDDVTAAQQLNGSRSDDNGSASDSGLLLSSSSALLSGAATTATTPVATAVVAAMPRPLRQRMRLVYRDVRRALALRVVALCDVPSPDDLVAVLCCMHTCGALADDVLCAIVKQLLHTHDAALSQSQPQQPFARRGCGDALLSWHVASSAAAAAASSSRLSPRAALLLTQLLGSQTMPYNYLAHRLLHTVLLPVMRSTLAEVAAAAATNTTQPAASLFTVSQLCDVTRCFVSYAVSGTAVVHLTALWLPQVQQCSVQQCVHLLQLVSTSARGTQRLGRQQQQHASLSLSRTAATHGDAVARIAAEDYQPLVEAVCARIAVLCAQSLHADDSDKDATAAAAAVTDDTTTATSTCTSTLTPEVLLSVMAALCRVDSVEWFALYSLVATAAQHALTTRLRAIYMQTHNDKNSNSSSSGGGGDGAAVCVLSDALLETLLPCAATVRVVRALLHRNTLVPHHTLHRVLLRRLLLCEAALHDATLASTALLAYAHMTPQAEQDAAVAAAAASTTTIAADTASADRGSHSSSSNDKDSSTTTTALATAAATTTTAVTVTAAVLLSTAAMTADESAHALRLLRRHGSRLQLSAFVAGVCVSPLQTLPARAQTHVVTYLTSIASAIAPATLARGVAACAARLPTATALDAVSLRRLFSRFEARDVVRGLDAVCCAQLLAVLAHCAAHAESCALSRQTLVARVCTLLQRGSDDDGEGAAAVSLARNASDVRSGRYSGEATVAALPMLVDAMRSSHTLYANVYARMCRLLLGHVSQSPWQSLLPAFAAVADESGRRAPAERDATLFRDVWEHLRRRVMTASSSGSSSSITTAVAGNADGTTSDEEGDGGGSTEVLTLLSDVMCACNGFAALDVDDRPLFAVLSHSLCEAVRVEVATAATTTTSNSSSNTRIDVVVEGSDNDDNDTQRRALCLATACDSVVRALTPSAIGAVCTTLLRRHRYDQDNHAEDECAGEAVSRRRVRRALLSAALLALSSRSRDLYPADVLHLMRELLQSFAHTAAHVADNTRTDDAKKGDDSAMRAATQLEDEQQQQQQQHVMLLHRAYDACRDVFLLMYGVATPLHDDIRGTRNDNGTPARVDASTTATTTDTTSPLPADALCRALTRDEAARVTAQRAAWTAPTRASVAAAPRTLGADVLLLLCQAGLVDEAVAAACAVHVCMSRRCLRTLPPTTLIELCLAVYEQLPLPLPQQQQQEEAAAQDASAHEATASAHATTTTTTTADAGATTTTAVWTRRRVVAALLTAVWDRVEELTSIAQMDALLRCLRHHHGTRVDCDFVARLDAQRALLLQRQQAKTVTATTTATTATTTSTSTSTSTGTSTSTVEDKAEDTTTTTGSLTSDMLDAMLNNDA